MVDRSRVIEGLIESLEGYREWGISWIACSSFEKSFPVRDASGAGLLEELARQVENCADCGLNLQRKNPVFGKGNPKATLMFIGEAPGRDEDMQGVPFVGAAGRLLTKIIEAMGLKREEVYIANLLKCRPPENRDPTDREIEACFPFLQKQISIIKPKIICALGRHATRTILKTETGISKLRGRFYEVGGMKVMPTYHPSFLLRNPEMKRPVWEDMKVIKREYDIILAEESSYRL